MKKEELMDLWSLKSRGLSERVKNQVLVPSGRNGKYNARDYVTANCLVGEVLKIRPDIDFSKISDISELYSILPSAVRFRLQGYTPCLASRYDELKEDKKAEVFESRDWVATQKMNGVRGWLVLMRTGVKLFSRNYSDVDCTLLEYWNNIYQGEDDMDINPTVVDVEIVFESGVDISDELGELGLATSSPLDAMVALLHLESDKAIGIQRRYKERYGKDLVCMRMIAPLYWNNVNYVKRSLGDGMDVYDDVLRYVQGFGINLKSIPRCDGSRVEKEAFLNSILAIGGEGVVFHNRKGMYCTSENRSKESYIKLKRTVSASVGGVGMGDTIDAFVSGFKLGSVGTVNEGLVSTLEFSIWLNDGGEMVKKFIGAVPGIEMDMKRTLTVSDGGMYLQDYVGSDGQVHWVGMNPEYDGKVAELSGQALSSVNQRLEHPRLIRWRFERDMNSCIYTKEWLVSQSTNMGIKYNNLG